MHTQPRLALASFPPWPDTGSVKPVLLSLRSSLMAWPTWPLAGEQVTLTRLFPLPALSSVIKLRWGPSRRHCRTLKYAGAQQKEGFSGLGGPFSFPRLSETGHREGVAILEAHLRETGWREDSPTAETVA